MQNISEMMLKPTNQKGYYKNKKNNKADNNAEKAIKISNGVSGEQ